jgi:hypothetical protein
MHAHERRRRRSDDTVEAVGLLLEACRERNGLDALVIADRDGMVVSSSARPGVQPEVIAAHLPRTHLREQVPALHARTFKAHGIRLFLGAVGAHANMTDRLLADLLHAMRGTQRILG